jgi:hypothetical protein
MVMRTTSLFVLASLVSVGLGCSSKSSTSTDATDPNRLPSLQTESPPANGFQVVMPIYKGVQPGDSIEVCTWTDKVLDADIDVRGAQGFQTKTGHHLILYWTTKVQDAGTTRICKDEDMASFRYVIGAGGEGQDSKVALPGELAAHIPKGAQLVVNHHYLNAGAAPMDAQSAMNVELADPGKTYTRTGALAWVNSSIRVPPGKSSINVSCTMKNDAKLWYAIPHMHQWGTHIRVVHEPVGAAQNALFDLDWDPDFAFHPPEQRHDPAQPYVIKKGDKMTVSCDWNNTTSGDLTFGMEMCVAFAQYVDTDNLGNIACDDGQWTGF